MSETTSPILVHLDTHDPYGHREAHSALGAEIFRDLETDEIEHVVVYFECAGTRQRDLEVILAA